jgi:DNA-binding CsgD family transcriptional regulator
MGRPWSPLSVRLAFWEGLDAGLSVAVAAQAAGVSRPTAYRWLSDRQKVLPSPIMDFSVPRAGLLSLREREEIGFQLAQGHGVRRIAAFLGRAPSTISREIARNRVSDRYSPSLVQEQTWARARRPKPRTLDWLALREQSPRCSPTGSARNRSLADSRWSIRRIRRCRCHTRNDLSGPLRSRPRILAPGSCDGAAVRAGCVGGRKGRRVLARNGSRRW